MARTCSSKFFSKLIKNVGFVFQIIFRLSHPKTTSNRPVRSPLAPSGGGRAFEDTLIGSFLSKSCLPGLPGKPYLFFEKPKTMTERDVELTASTMWQVRFYQKTTTEDCDVLVFSQCKHIKKLYLNYLKFL
jgi:hypothetical protein